MEHKQRETMQDKTPEQTIEEHRKWINQQKAEMMKYCRTKQLDADRLLDKHNAGLVPYFALWGVENRKERKKYWVITGDLPHDHIPFDAAKTPQEALRHFSMSWQLKAEKMQIKQETNQPLIGTVEQHENMINLLRESAVNIYDISEDEKLWQRGL